LAEPTRDDWIIERAGPRHERSAFDCGNPMLSDWLKLRVGQFEKRDLARAYVAVRRGEAVVVGYYAISNHRVDYEALPDDQAKGLPRMDIPVVLLGRLAVDRTAQGRGLGSLLLVDALRRSLHLSEHVGIRAVEVEAFDDAAHAFYVKFGFVPLLDDPRHLFLAIQAVRKLGLPPMTA